MTPPDGAVIVEFDPHVIWALLCITFALVITFLVIAAQHSESERGRRR